ncbi:MAG: polysaccharide deacetylase family protein [Psychromonas sp.]|nr:polysaccharide deacetylase family protein [Alteromonadales bacterium]MCP5077380.1 polysaccharide deacetylase family protein [Psychromonas sp.]
MNSKLSKICIAVALASSVSSVMALTPLPFTTGLDASQLPPGSIEVAKAPQFIAIAFDDNFLINNGTPGEATLGGQEWVLDLWGKLRNPAGNGNLDTYDGLPLHTTFFNTCTYIDSGTWNASFIKQSWFNAKEAGHEVGNHTTTHTKWAGSWMDVANWTAEIDGCNQAMAKPFNPDQNMEVPSNDDGIGASATGFRAPHLDYNAATFKTLSALNFRYDASIMEGYQWDQNGSNNFWPYTLDNGSPGAELSASWGTKPAIGNHAGLWEVPIYAFIVPTEAELEKYGINYSLRQKMAEKVSWFDVGAGKVESVDYALFFQYGLSADEVLAILKHNLDLRLNGNHAPMTFLAHSEQYSDQVEHWASSETSNSAERRAMLEEFLDYALSKPEVRIVSHSELLDWMEEPVALGTEHCYRDSWSVNVGYEAGEKVLQGGALWEAKWWSFNTTTQDFDWSPWAKVMDCE